MLTPSTDDLNQVFRHFVGKEIDLRVFRTNDEHGGAYTVTVRIPEEAMRQAPKEAMGFMRGVLDLLATTAAVAFWEEHRTDVLNQIDPLAVANLAIVEAAKALRQDLIDPKKGDGR